MSVIINGTNGVTFNDATLQGTAFVGGRAEVFTTSGIFTPPPGVTAVKVTVVGGGGGGGGGASSASYGGGGGGGVAVEWITGLSGAVTVTVGTGGASAAAGLTSSFGAFCSATGGAGGSTTAVASVTIGGDGGVGSGGTYNLAGGVGANGYVDQSNNKYGGPGGGSGAEMTAKNWSAGWAELIACINYEFVTNPNGAKGYINGKGGNSTGRAIANTAGNAASGFGNGGGGAVRTTINQTGGAGSNGIVIVEY